MILAIKLQEEKGTIVKIISVIVRVFHFSCIWWWFCVFFFFHFLMMALPLESKVDRQNCSDFIFLKRNILLVMMLLSKGLWKVWNLKWLWTHICACCRVLVLRWHEITNSLLQIYCISFLCTWYICYLLQTSKIFLFLHSPSLMNWNCHSLPSHYIWSPKGWLSFISRFTLQKIDLFLNLKIHFLFSPFLSVLFLNRLRTSSNDF